MKVLSTNTFRLLLIGPIILLPLSFAQEQSTAAIVHDKDPSVERLIENSKDKPPYTNDEATKKEKVKESKERTPASKQEEMKLFRNLERPLYDRRYK